MTLETTSAPLTKSNLEQLAQQTAARLGRAEDWPIIYNAFASHLGFVTVAEPELTGSERARMQQHDIDREDARTGNLSARDAGTGQIHKVPEGGFAPGADTGFTGEGSAGANDVPSQAEPVFDEAGPANAPAGEIEKAEVPTMHPDDAGNPVPNDPIALDKPLA